MSRLRSFWRKIGPALVTGASDDDPSGIAIYSQAGAMTGVGLLWTALITFPLMVAIQEICARIGLTTGRGLAGNLKRSYPRWILLPIILIAVAGNTLNIGADLAAMASTTHLLLPIPEPLLAMIFATMIILGVVFISYQKLANILKWVALSLLAYIAVPFFAQTNWREAIYHTVVPSLSMDRQTVLLLVAILGTTISPYLFFWQTSMEVEDRLSKFKRFFARRIVTKHELRAMEGDVTAGMLFSNIVMWFIIVAAAVTLNKVGVTDVGTTKDAAEALRPIVGPHAYLIFCLGVLSIGFLAVPVLAGASSYALSEVFGWSEGLDRSFHRARQFYLVMIVSTLIGLLIPLLGFDPIKALFYTGVFYGLTAPILIFAIMHVANNRAIMGSHTNSATSNLLGYLTFVLMAAAAVAALIL